MEVWPAIDLRGGKCVRLQQGDYDRETVFGDDPASIARQWAEQGPGICISSISTVPGTATEESCRGFRDSQSHNAGMRAWRRDSR